MFDVCIAHCMRKSTKCQNVTILVSSCGALYRNRKLYSRCSKTCLIDQIERQSITNDTDNRYLVGSISAAEQPSSFCH